MENVALSSPTKHLTRYLRYKWRKGDMEEKNLHMKPWQLFNNSCVSYHCKLNMDEKQRVLIQDKIYAQNCYCWGFYVWEQRLQSAEKWHQYNLYILNLYLSVKHLNGEAFEMVGNSIARKPQTYGIHVHFPSRLPLCPKFWKLFSALG